LEDRFEEVLSPAERRSLDRQKVVGGSKVIGRVDYRDGDLPLIVEVNSLAFHTAPSDRAADEKRYSALNAGGFTVAVVWEPDLWSRPRNVVETVRRARSEAKARSPRTLHSAGCPWPSDPARLVIDDNRAELRG
jgi:very-short-patch-repair endonuclease